MVNSLFLLGFSDNLLGDLLLLRSAVEDGGTVFCYDETQSVALYTPLLLLTYGFPYRVPACRESSGHGYADGTQRAEMMQPSHWNHEAGPR
jgi:hypothetical protein